MRGWSLGGVRPTPRQDILVRQVFICYFCLVEI